MSWAKTPVTVRVDTGYSMNSTIRIVEHELGHTRGLHHYEQPMPLMAPKGNFTTLPDTDAANSSHPWGGTQTLTVYLDDRAPQWHGRKALAHAISYYEAGAQGWVPSSESYSYRFVQTEKNADIRVTIKTGSATYSTPSGTRSIGAGAVHAVWGLDPDRDGRLETYTHLNVVVASVSGRQLSWMLGAELASAYGNTSTPEPPAFRTGSDRSAAYWQTGS